MNLNNLALSWFINPKQHLMKRLVYLLLLFSFLSCKKNDINTNRSDNTDNSFLLLKIIDSIKSIPKEDRISFYYTASNLCDTVTSEYQTIFQPYTEFWSYSRLRYEYNSANLPRKVYKKQHKNDPEHLYSEIQYDSLGRIKKQLCYNETFTYTYDNSGRLIRDTQYNQFGLWDFVYVYVYDSRDNVKEFRTVYRISGDSASAFFSYDSAINPLHKSWNLYTPDPKLISRNNVTVSPYETIQYQYNGLGLPIKARVFRTGQSEPIIRTYVYK